MAKQGARGASSVLDALNSGDELTSDNTLMNAIIEITEERIKHGGTDSEQGNELTSSSSLNMLS